MRYSNGIAMDAAFAEALLLFIDKAHSEGSTSTSEEIAAAFEVMIMDAAGIDVPARTRRLAQNFEDEINGVYGTAPAAND